MWTDLLLCCVGFILQPRSLTISKPVKFNFTCMMILNKICKNIFNY